MEKEHLEAMKDKKITTSKKVEGHVCIREHPELQIHKMKKKVQEIRAVTCMCRTINKRNFESDENT